MPRKSSGVDMISATGAECLRRATLEFQRRFMGNKTEVLFDADDEPAIEIMDRQLMATVLDLRTARMSHLTFDQCRQALDVLKAEYIEFYTTCSGYKRRSELDTTSKSDNEEELVSSDEDNTPYHKKQKVGDHSSRLQDSSKVSCGVPYSNTGHLSLLFEDGLSSSSEEEQEEDDQDFPTENELIKEDRADAALEFDKVIKKWLKKTVQWKKLFPNEIKTDTPDLVKDLMPLNMGVVYNDIINSDMDRKRYGYLGISFVSCMNTMGSIL